MKSVEMIKNRFTTKLYEAGYKVSDAVKNDILEVLQYSPSSINSQPWRFYAIQNQDLKLELSEVSKHNKDKIIDCGLLIVFTALRLDEFLVQFDKYGADGAKTYYEKNMKQKSRDELEGWIRNQVYISLGFVLASLGFDGIDSTSLEGIEKEEYERILKIDTNKERVQFALAIGKSSADDKNKPSVTSKVRLPKDVIIKEIL